MNIHNMVVVLALSSTLVGAVAAAAVTYELMETTMREESRVAMLLRENHEKLIDRRAALCKFLRETREGMSMDAESRMRLDEFCLQ